MTHEEVIADIRRYGFNTVRWGHVPFSRKVAETLLRFTKEYNHTPEYFLVGQSAVMEIMAFPRDELLVDIQHINGDTLCTIMGLPVFVDRNMPDNMLALICPEFKLFPGAKYETVAHCASYIENSEKKQ